jgi:hypothetical protein
VRLRDDSRARSCRLVPPRQSSDERRAWSRVAATPWVASTRAEGRRGDSDSTPCPLVGQPPADQIRWAGLVSCHADFVEDSSGHEVNKKGQTIVRRNACTVCTPTRHSRQIWSSASHHGLESIRGCYSG